MKIKFAFTLLAVLVSGHAAAKTWVLTSAESSVEKGNRKISSDELKVKIRRSALSKKSCTAASRKAVKSSLLAVKMA